MVFFAASGSEEHLARVVSRFRIAHKDANASRDVALKLPSGMRWLYLSGNCWREFSSRPVETEQRVKQDIA
jgi:hypothetical protein